MPSGDAADGAADGGGAAGDGGGGDGAGPHHYPPEWCPPPGNFHSEIKKVINHYAISFTLSQST